jgi:hypothetical protein
MRLLVLTMIALAAATVRAETPAGPCTDDIARFCKDVPATEGRLRACLLEHETALAPACRVRVAGGGSKTPAMGPQEMVACRADLDAHCAGVPSGGGRLRGCLQEHADALAPKCKAALARSSAAKKP